MTTFTTLPADIELELATSELWAAAQYLDAVDGGLIPPNPEKYQQAARLAAKILGAYSSPKLDRLCAMSWSLGEVLETIHA